MCPAGGSDGEEVAAADVCLYGLNTVMPLMTAELLRFPALCSRYFKLITFLCEITPTRVRRPLTIRREPVSPRRLCVGTLLAV